MERVIRLVVQPESRTACSGEGGTNKVVVILQWATKLVCVPAARQLRGGGLLVVEPAIISAALAAVWCPGVGAVHLALEWRLW